MKKAILFALALGSCLWGATAFAQDNPAGGATPAATPDGASVPASGDDVIQLHMPVHHRAVHAHASPNPAENTAPAATPTIDTIGADTTASPAATAPISASAEAPSPPKAAPSARAAKSAHAPAKQAAPTIPFSFGEDSGTAPSAPAGNPEPEAAASTHETKTASLPPKPEVPKPAPLPAKPVKVAVHPKGDEHAGMTKRGAVLFAKGVSNPSPQQFDGLKLLAGDVSTALESGASRVQLEAYGGAPGDKSSDARRLSLKRALAVRQLLIDNGIPSNRIDVRAMGGADDKGPNDRVDVYLRTG